MIMHWDTLQEKVHGLDLNDFLKEEFIDLMNEEFDNKKVEVVNIQICVKDKEPDMENDILLTNLLTLFKRDIKDSLLDDVIVDADDEFYYDKFKKVIKKFEDD